MKRITALSLLGACLALCGCSSDPNVWRGQAGGAAIGGLTGGLVTDSWGGAAVGAAVGGLIGGEVARNR